MLPVIGQGINAQRRVGKFVDNRIMFLYDYFFYF